MAEKIISIAGIEKPAYGEPCNGCGHCCEAEVCEIGMEFIRTVPTVTPCPAIEHEDGRAYCGLVRRPAHYMFGEDAPKSETGWISVKFAAMLGFGHGCDSGDGA